MQPAGHAGNGSGSRRVKPRSIASSQNTSHHLPAQWLNSGAVDDGVHERGPLRLPSHPLSTSAWPLKRRTSIPANNPGGEGVAATASHTQPAYTTHQQPQTRHDERFCLHSVSGYGW